MAGFIVNGTWLPTDVPKQLEVFNDFHRYLLCEGARRSGKSVGLQHKVFRHMAQNPFAKVAIVTRFIKGGKQGVWSDLTGPIYRTWNAAKMVEFVDGTPSMDPSTKMPYFRLRSRSGAISECQLMSIDHDEDAEEKFKDTRFSMIYLVEADRFDEVTFSTLCQQLRSLEVPASQQQFLLDTNPPEDGTDHWLHRRFIDPVGDVDYADWASKYRSIHFDLDDNPYLSDSEKKDLYRDYASDPAKLARYYYGRWERDSSDSAFADVFLFNVHVVGSYDHKVPESEQSLLRPAHGTYVIDTGWDIGDVNTFVSFGVPRFADSRTICYDIVDEFAALQEKMKLETLVDNVIAKMDQLNAYCQETLKLPKPPMWRHWSDPSSMRYKIAGGTTEAQLVHLLSGGRIDLIPVSKGDGSVKGRLDMLRRMLFEERIFFSANCIRSIDTLRSLKKGSSATHLIDRTSKYKHAFDAITYMLSGAMPEEIAGLGVQIEKPSSFTLDLSR
jgi:hypothetical protein